MSKDLIVEEMKKEKVRQRAKKYYQNNKDKELQYQKAHSNFKYNNNSEYREKHLKICEEYRKNHREYYREYARQYRLRKRGIYNETD